ncbi:hypothetical protein [Allosphingosinicella sp.]|jgi:hypothetical protein|uniref:hypothetical protein n=1 Tax=Allosphingosinicella sp. TaxID=2823234 RepID=UPI002F13049B
MSEARPFASLSSGLLARKGAAKPAMRPQAFGQVAASLDDLGWNDMGEAPPQPEHVPSSIAALTPAPRPGGAAVEESLVRDQQRAIADTFADEIEAEEESPAEAVRPAPAPAPVVKMPRRREMFARDKAAFTLRLDPERHFRLRLACAVTGRSAQQIVTGALDQILNTIPELDALAGQLPVKTARRS